MQAALGNIEDDRKRSLALVRASTLQLHAMGAIVREIPRTVVRMLARLRDRHPNGVPWSTLLQDNTRSDAYIKSVRIARDTEELFNDMLSTNTRLCNSPVSLDFSSMVLFGKHRTDTQVDVAMTLANPSANNPTARYRPSAVVAWGVADANEYFNNELYHMNFRTTTLNASLSQGRIAEIDLVCSSAEAAGGRRGLGRVLLARTLSKIARILKNGERRFDAVIMYLAKESNTATPPLLRGANKLGFRPISVNFNPASDTAPRFPQKRQYCILSDLRGVKWEMQVAKEMVWTPPASKQCPLAPRSGRTYCQ